MNGYHRLILPVAMLLSFALGALIYGKPVLSANAATPESGPVTKVVPVELQAGYPARIHDAFLVTVANFDTVAIFPNSSFHREYSYGDQCLALAGGTITI